MFILITSIWFVFNAFSTACIACELGQRTSGAFEEIEDMIGQYHWYLFPDEVKRILPIILMGAQQSAEWECFGSFSCNRDTLKKVTQINLMNLY